MKRYHAGKQVEPLKQRAHRKQAKRFMTKIPVDSTVHFQVKQETSEAIGERAEITVIKDLEGPILNTTINPAFSR
jgi:hypothetical protein